MTEIHCKLSQKNAPSRVLLPFSGVCRTAFDNSHTYLQPDDERGATATFHCNMADEANTGDFYNGAVNENGTAHGIGEMRYAAGSVYDGDWRNGKVNGKGTMKSADGEEYDGEWENDAAHGKGT